MRLPFPKKQETKKPAEVKKIDPVTAEFINVKDINDHFLYTEDGFINVYIKVNPVNIELQSAQEIKQLTRDLTVQLGGGQLPLKLMCVPRPIDLSQLLTKYSMMLKNTVNHIEKELLREEIRSINQYILKGEVTEQEYYFMFWIEASAKNAEVELLNRAKAFCRSLANSKVQSHVMEKQEIILLCNLVNNPAYVNVEELSIDKTIPLI